MCTYTLVLAVGSTPLNTLVVRSSYHRDINCLVQFFFFPSTISFSPALAVDTISFFRFVTRTRERLVSFTLTEPE